MQFIALQNFKSYERQLLNNLNPQINIIIGKNGQGKSNFFKAITFALTNKVTLNKSEYISHKHRAVDNENRPIKVQLYVKSKLNQQKYDQNIQHLERIWQNDTTEELRVNDKPFTAQQYETFVQSLGFSYSNPYNIIQQGKITQITLMDEFEIYKLLQQATGIKKYEKRLQQALEYMKKNQEQKNEISRILKQIQSRLNSYQEKREEYEYYNFEQKANKVKNKIEFQTLIKKFDSQIKSLKEKEANSYDELNKLKLGIKDKQSDLGQLNDKISVNQKQMYSFVDSTMDDELLNVSVNLSQENKESVAKLKKISANKDKLKKQLQKATSQVQKVKQEMKPSKEKYDYLTSQLQAMKTSKLGLAKGKQELKGQISKLEQHAKEMGSQLKKVNKMKSQFKISPGIIQLNDINAKKQKLSQVQNELRANRIKYFQASRKKNQYQSQAEIAKQHIQFNYSKMRKLLPALDFNLLNELRKQKIQGVYGFLIEFLSIQSDFLFAYEISGLNKLCTLLVENEQVCNVVVNLNKKIKGRQINILPMSFVKKMANAKRAIPQIDDCFSLLNDQWVHVKPHNYGDQFTKLIDKIVANTFGGHLLVKDYDIGLKVSKEFHLNCITADKQIVYSQGYLCKVGKDANIDDRLQTYLKYQEKNVESERLSMKLTQVNKEVIALQNEQLDLMKKKVQLQSQIRNNEIKLDVINEQKKSLNRLQQQIENLQQKKSKYEQDIKRKVEILNNYDKKGQININMNEYKETQQLYKGKLKLYNEKSQQQCQLQNKLLECVKEEQQINQELKNINSQLSFQKHFNHSFVVGKEYQQNLQQATKRLQFQKQGFQAQILKLSQFYAQKQAQNFNFLGQIALLQDQIRYYASKIEEIGSLDVTMQEIEQKSNSFSLSISRMDEKRKMRLYSAGQKLMFAKIEAFIEKYKQSVKKLEQLELHQRHLTELIHSFQTEKDKSISNIFTNFEKYFDSVFKNITLHGKTDIRLKKVNDRSRGILKTKNSIAIMVSFAGETTKTWNQFSGGQKTVIAICLLMALQKCQPAPFYVLDEIDSALDQVYLQRIVKLIERQSEHSQYFITTFKQQMLALKQQKCNYYLVSNMNRVSSMQRISLEEAKEAMQELVER